MAYSFPLIEAVDIEYDEGGVFLHLEGDFIEMCQQYVEDGKNRLSFRIDRPQAEKICGDLEALLYDS